MFSSNQHLLWDFPRLPQVKQEHFRIFVTTVEQNPLGFTEFVERCREISFPENFIEYLGFLEPYGWMSRKGSDRINGLFSPTYK